MALGRRLRTAKAVVVAVLALGGLCCCCSLLRCSLPESCAVVVVVAVLAAGGLCCCCRCCGARCRRALLLLLLLRCSLPEGTAVVVVLAVLAAGGLCCCCCCCGWWTRGRPLLWARCLQHCFSETPGAAAQSPAVVCPSSSYSRTKTLHVTCRAR